MIQTPDINIKQFEKDYMDNVCAYDLQDKYKISPRQYRMITRTMHSHKREDSTKRKKVKRFKNLSDFHEPYVSLCKDEFLVRYKCKYYGRYKTLEHAKFIKKCMVECEWDTSLLNGYREQIGYPPIIRRKSG